MDKCKICDKRIFDDLVYCEYSDIKPDEPCKHWGREPGADDNKGENNDG